MSGLLGLELQMFCELLAMLLQGDEPRSSRATRAEASLQFRKAISYTAWLSGNAHQWLQVIGSYC